MLISSYNIVSEILYYKIIWIVIKSIKELPNMETQHDSLKLFYYKLLSSAHSGKAGGHPCRTNHTSTLETPLDSKDTQNQRKTGPNCELLFTWKECVRVVCVMDVCMCTLGCLLQPLPTLLWEPTVHHFGGTLPGCQAASMCLSVSTELPLLCQHHAWLLHGCGNPD